MPLWKPKSWCNCVNLSMRSLDTAVFPTRHALRRNRTQDAGWHKSTVASQHPISNHMISTSKIPLPKTLLLKLQILIITFIDFKFNIIFNVLISILTLHSIIRKFWTVTKNCKQWDFHSVFDLCTSKSISNTNLKTILREPKRDAAKWRFLAHNFTKRV